MKKEERERLKKLFVELIQRELSYGSLKKTSGYRNSIWFYPKEGMFLYNDCFINSKVVIEMINEKLIVLHSFGQHQGIEMIRYTIPAVE